MKDPGMPMPHQMALTRFHSIILAMEEELTFDDMDTSSEILGRPTASSRSHSSQEGTGVIPIPVANRSFGGTLNPGSPGGSLGSASVASRSSDAGRSHARSMKSFERGVDRLSGSHDHIINRMSSI